MPQIGTNNFSLRSINRDHVDEQKGSVLFAGKAASDVAQNFQNNRKSGDFKCSTPNKHALPDSETDKNTPISPPKLSKIKETVSKDIEQEKKQFLENVLDAAKNMASAKLSALLDNPKMKECVNIKDFYGSSLAQILARRMCSFFTNHAPKHIDQKAIENFAKLIKHTRSIIDIHACDKNGRSFFSELISTHCFIYEKFGNRAPYDSFYKLFEIFNTSELSKLANNIKIAYLLNSLYQCQIEVFLKIFENLSPDVNEKDTSGNTLAHLIWAYCRKDDEFLIHFLKAKGCNFNVQNNAGETALHKLSKERLPKITHEMIVIGNVNVNAMDNHGNTPLHLACKHVSIPLYEDISEDIIQILINAGSDINAKNIKGEIAITIAKIMEETISVKSFQVAINAMLYEKSNELKIKAVDDCIQHVFGAINNEKESFRIRGLRKEDKKIMMYAYMNKIAKKLIILLQICGSISKLSIENQTKVCHIINHLIIVMENTAEDSFTGLNNFVIQYCILMLLEFELSLRVLNEELTKISDFNHYPLLAQSLTEKITKAKHNIKRSDQFKIEAETKPESLATAIIEEAFAKAKIVAVTELQSKLKNGVQPIKIQENLRLFKILRDNNFQLQTYKTIDEIYEDILQVFVKFGTRYPARALAQHFMKMMGA